MIVNNFSSLWERHIFFVVDVYWFVHFISATVSFLHISTKVVDNSQSLGIFRQKSRTLGLSCAPPLCRWQPKNFSKGSWHSLWLKNTLTPRRVERYSTSSMNEWAVKMNVNISYIKFHLPVILRPRSASWLNNIHFCSHLGFETFLLVYTLFPFVKVRKKFSF